MTLFLYSHISTVQLWYHPIFNNGYNYLSMLGLKLIYASKNDSDVTTLFHQHIAIYTKSRVTCCGLWHWLTTPPISGKYHVVCGRALRIYVYVNYHPCDKGECITWEMHQDRCDHSAGFTMAPWHGHTIPIAGPWWGETTFQRCVPLTKDQ